MRTQTAPSLDWTFDGLDTLQQKRLIAILEQVMLQAEPMSAIERERLLEENSDLREQLLDALEGLEWVGKLPVTHEQPASVPSNLGKFRILRELGRGAMGIVYEAIDTEFQDASLEASTTNPAIVAVKVLQARWGQANHKLERFYREAKAASSVQHPSVVPVYETGCADGVHYFTMKRIEGESLAQWLSAYDSRSRSTDTALSFHRIASEFAGLAEGLYRVHRAGILHRDIKPSNILIDRDRHFWILDFGLAYVFDGESLTRSGDLIGTFKYMSPEQAGGKTDFIDARSDIYSLGITLYETLTGVHPFYSYEGARLLRAIQTTEPKSPRMLRPDIPRELETIVLRAIRPDKNTRYSSAKELADDLHRFVLHEPIQAKRVSYWERVREWNTKYPERMLVGMLLLILGTVGLGIHTSLLQREQLQTQIQLERGDANYQQARAAVDSLGSKVAERLATLPGAETLRQEVLAETLSYYKTFIDNANNDPNLTGDVAKTQWKMAHLIRVAGSQEDATLAFERAIDALESEWSLTKKQAVLNVLIQSLNELAWMQLASSELTPASQTWTKAKEYLPSVTDRSNIALTHAITANTEAGIAFKSGDLERANRCAKATVDLLKHFMEQSPTLGSSSEYEAGLTAAAADALSNLGVILTDQGELALAQTVATRAIELRNQLHKAHSSPEDDRRLALSYNNLAALAWKQKKTSEAIQSYQSSVQLLERSIDALPGLVGPRRELAVTLNNLGMALTSDSQADRAIATFQKAIRLASSIADADPTNVEAAKHTGGIWNNLGVAYRERASSSLSIDAFENAVRYQSIVCSLVPESAREQALLTQYRSNWNRVAGSATSTAIQGNAP